MGFWSQIEHWDEVGSFGVMVAVITFIACYAYCFMVGGFLLGGALGWIPSLMAATVIAFLWPLLLTLAVAGAGAIVAIAAIN